MNLLFVAKTRRISLHMKRVFMSKDKDGKIKAQITVGNRTTIGENVAQLELEQKREKEVQQNTLRYIESIVCMDVQHNNLQNLKFIIIHIKFYKYLKLCKHIKFYKYLYLYIIGFMEET